MLCERLDKNNSVGGGGRSGFYLPLEEGTSPAHCHVRAANTRGAEEMHMADLDRVERINRRGFDFNYAAGRSYRRGGLCVQSGVL